MRTCLEKAEHTACAGRWKGIGHGEKQTWTLSGHTSKLASLRAWFLSTIPSRVGKDADKGAAEGEGDSVEQAT